MPQLGNIADRVRVGLLVVTAAVVCALAVVAYRAGLPGADRPHWREHLPAALKWFGRPGSESTLTLAVGLIAAVCALAFLPGGASRVANPVVRIVIGLTLSNFVLAMSSYWSCHDATRPQLYTPLMWTVGLLKGGIDDKSLDGVICPAQTPIALEVARLSALAAILIGIGGVVIALGRSQADRLRVRLDAAVTVVVGIDDDASSMVSAVRNTLEARSRLVVLTALPDRPCVQRVRREGARVVLVDFARPETLASLALWSKLDRLYLLSSDPATNLQRLRVISTRMAAVSRKRRIPLIVRIDDPWQAEAWRARQFGGSDNQWAADAVGKYEVTASRLLETIIGDTAITRILVGGTSPLTLALCADMAQRHREWTYHDGASGTALPTLTLIGEHAEEYLQDHEFHQEQRGLTGDRPSIDAVAERLSVPVMVRELNADNRGAEAQAVILVDDATGTAGSDTIGTRLAVRFPGLLIYTWDPGAHSLRDAVPIMGQLRTFALTMDLPDGAAQDAWERAAQLIHERYAAHAHVGTVSAQPWANLSEFYRGSNRRQVRTTLSLVETIGGHSWSTADGQPAPLPDPGKHGHQPLELLRQLGFDTAAATAMARAEHDDWCNYYRAAGWTWGEVRDFDRKVHEKLVAWDDPRHTAAFKDIACQSLADTLLQLAALGYRSTPLAWQRYRRTGVITARQRPQAWTWRTASGDTLHGNADDWEVHDDAGNSWSVRDDIFRATYQHEVDDRWRRTGVVTARGARPGETIDTLEGAATAGDGDFIVRGEHGEQWPVPAAQFAQRYEGPLAPS